MTDRQPYRESPFVRVLTLLKQIETAIAIAAFLIMVVVLMMDVLGRELIDRGLFGASGIAVYMMIYCAMAGFGIATDEGSHLRPRFADGLVPDRSAHIAARLGNLISAIILTVLAIGGLRLVLFSVSIDDRSMALDLAVWPVQMMIPIGFILSALRHVMYALSPDLDPADCSATSEQGA